MACGLGLASCFSPIYDEAISSAALFHDRLPQPFRIIGPISMSPELAFDGEFMPTRVADPIDGFWVSRIGDSVQVDFIRNLGTSRFLVDGLTIPSNLAQASFARSAAPRFGPRLILFSGIGGFRLLEFSAATSVMSELPAYNPIVGRPLFGAGGNYSGTPGVDRISLLYDDAIQGLSVASFLLDALGFDLASFQTPDVNPGASVIGGMGKAFFDGTRLVMSKPESGDSYLWAGGLALAPLALDTEDPVVALISDGSFVAQGENFLSAFDAGGGQIFNVPGGNVRFAHELYSDGVAPNPSPAGPWLYFSQALVERTRDRDEVEVYVYVWRLPTSFLGALGR